MKKPTNKTRRLKPLSLYPLKAEEALALFMRVDPAEVEVGVWRLQPKRVKSVLCQQDNSDGLCRDVNGARGQFLRALAT